MTYAHPVFTTEAVAAAAAPARGRRRAPRLRRRPPRLGLPRGRLPLRRRGRRVVRGDAGDRARRPAAARRSSSGTVSHAPPYAAAARLHAPPLPVAGRRRRPAAAALAAALLARFDARDHLDGGRLGGGHPRRPRPLPRRTRASSLEPEDRVLMLAHARVARPRLRPAHRLLVPAPRRRAAWPWCSRCTTPTASGTPTSRRRRARSRPGRQGVLRLAVQRRLAARTTSACVLDARPGRA